MYPAMCLGLSVQFAPNGSVGAIELRCRSAFTCPSMNYNLRYAYIYMSAFFCKGFDQY